MMALKLLGEPETGALRLGKRANAAIAQPGDQRREHMPRHDGVAERGVPVLDVDVEPGGDRLERIVGKIGVGDRRQQANAKAARLDPVQSGALRFLLENGEIESDREADEDAPGGEGGEAIPCHGEGGSACNGGVGDAVDRRRRRGDREAGVDEDLDAFSPVDDAFGDRHRTHLDDPVARSVETRRLGVDRDCVDGDQQCGAGRGLHEKSPARPECGGFWFIGGGKRKRLCRLTWLSA